MFTARFHESLGHFERAEEFLVPIVAASPHVAYTRVFDGGSASTTHTYDTRLVETASPRFTLGLRADLDELWRKR